MSALRKARWSGLMLALALVACAAPPRSTLRTASPSVGPLPTEEPDVGSRVDLDRAREVVRIARSHLGSPYRLGGTGAGGFDCSGLVHRSYAGVGIRLPRTSAALARVGRSIPRSELQVGDLVLFADSDGRVSHVGIWSGRGRFVHASSSRGVVEDAMDTGWFRDRYVGARRLLPTIPGEHE